MRVYGNLMNRIAESAKQIEPEVGMGATITSYSDRHAATIVSVELFKRGSNKGRVSTIKVQNDIAKRTDKNGMSESQEYEYTPNPNAYVRTFKLRKDGWREVGGSNGLIIGHRDQYYDFSF